MLVTIWSDLTDWVTAFQTWIYDHYNNPLLWLSLFILLLLFVMAGYNYLHKR